MATITVESVTIPNRFKREILKGSINFSSHVLKAALMKSSYVIDIDNHNNWADVSSDEVSGVGNGYAQQTLPNKTVVQNNTDNTGVFQCDEINFDANGGVIGPTFGVMIYDDTDSNKVNIMYVKFTLAHTILDGHRLNVATLGMIGS